MPKEQVNFAPVKTKVKKFNTQLGILCLVIVSLMILVHWLFHVEIGTWTWIAFGFFSLLTLFLNYLGIRALGKSQKTFLNFLYGSTLIRFIFSIFFIVIYLVINEVIDRPFIFSFLFLYLFFTSFEIYHLVTKLRAEK